MAEMAYSRKDSGRSHPVLQARSKNDDKKEEIGAGQDVNLR